MAPSGPAADGEGATVEQAARLFTGRLLAFVTKHLGDADAAQDVVQEVFLRALRHETALAGAHNPLAWLITVARSALVDHLRRTNRPLPADLAISPEEDGGEGWAELTDCVEPLLDRLPVSYREAVRHADLKGGSQTALARELGLSTSAVKSRVQRGRRMLRDAMAACCHLEVDQTGRLVSADQAPCECC